MTQSLGFKLEIFIEKMAKGIWPEPKPIRPIRQSLQKRAQQRASRAFRRQARRERRKRLEAEAWARRKQEETEAYIARIANSLHQRTNRKGTPGSATNTPNQRQQGQAPQQPEESATITMAHENGKARVDLEYTLPGAPREEDAPSRPLVSAFPSRLVYHSGEKYNEAVCLFLRQDNVEVLPVPKARERKRSPIVLTNAYEYYYVVRRLATEENRNGDQLDPFCSPSALLYMVYNGWVELDDVLSWKGGRDSLGRALVEFASRPGDVTSLIKGTYPTQPEMPMKPSERKVEWFAQKVSIHKKSERRACSKWSDFDDRLFNGPFGEEVKRFATPGVQERVLKELEVVRKGQQVTVQEDWRPLFWVLFRAVYQQRLRSTTISVPVSAWPAAAPSLFNVPLATRALEVPAVRGTSTTSPSRRSARRDAKPYSSAGAKRNLRFTMENASKNDDGSSKKRLTAEESGECKADRMPLGEINIVTPPVPTPKPASAVLPEAEDVTKEPSDATIEFPAEISETGEGETPTAQPKHHVCPLDAQATMLGTIQNPDASSYAPAPATSPNYQLAPATPAVAVTAAVQQSIYPPATTGIDAKTIIVTEPHQEDNVCLEPSQPCPCDVSMESIDITMFSAAPAPFSAPSSFVSGAIGPTSVPPDEMEMDVAVDAMDADVHYNIADSAQARTRALQNEIQMQVEPLQNGSASSWIPNADHRGQLQFGGQTQGNGIGTSQGQIPVSLTTSGTSPGAAVNELCPTTEKLEGYNGRSGSERADGQHIVPLLTHTLCTIEAQPNIFDTGAPATTSKPAFHPGVAPPKTEQQSARGKSRNKRNGLKRL